MTKEIKKIGVIGAGSWGTALAHLLCQTSDVTIWGPNEEVLKEISTSHTNKKYFPDDSINKALKTATSLEQLVKDKDILVLSTPSKAFRDLAEKLKPLVDDKIILVSTAKGLEAETFKRMSEVLVEVLGNEKRISVLSGPSFALEVLRNMPTAVTIAASNETTLKETVSVFHYGTFRVYSSNDMIGVELGGVIKNVIALAAGLLDGAAMGNNARAGLLTRGIVEIKRLAVALGAKESTIYGLSGLGDLILTATSDLSRNRRVGLRLGRGDNLETIIKDLGQVAEAVRSASFVLELAQKAGVEVPIIEQIERVVAGKATVKQAIASLFAREQSSE